MPAALLVVGGTVAALGALALLVNDSEGDAGRSFWLIQGKRYAISHRIAGPGWDASMYPGFCNFSEPVMTASGMGPTAWAEVQFTAEWCAPNKQFVVPVDMAIAEV